MILWILASAASKVLPLRNRLSAVQARASSPDSPLHGMRFQLLLALEVLERGHMAVLRIEQPRRAGGSRSEGGGEPAFRSDRDFAEPILALWVPGTMHPAPVGKTLIKLGWIKPSALEHWIPLLYFFEISDSGRRNLLRAREWWSQLGPLQKLFALVAE